jgi:hypothetical protein
VSAPAEEGAIILASVLIFNLGLGVLGRRWWKNSALRARQLSEGPRASEASTSPDPARSKLIIQRAGGYLRDAIRQYTVVVDGVRVGKVGAGESFVLDVAAGIHVVQIRIDGFGSARLSVECAAGAEVSLTCRPRDPSPFAVDDIILGLLGRRTWIVLERRVPGVETGRG